MSIIADLAQRRIADAESLQGERPYQLLTQVLPQIIWTANPAGEIEYFNRRWFDFTGLTLNQSPTLGWASVVHPDDLTGSIEAWNASIAHGTPYEVEQRLKRGSDDAYCWHLCRALPARDAAGSIVRWFGTATDIDAHKRNLETAQQTAAHFEFIVKMSDRLADVAAPGKVLEMLCELVVTAQFADCIAVHVIESDGRTRTAAIAHRDPEFGATIADLRGSYGIDLGGRDGVATVVRTGRPAIATTGIADKIVEARGDHHAAVKRLGIVSTICVPLIVRGRTIAVLDAGRSQSDRRYAAADVSFFEQLANRAAGAFEQALRRDEGLVDKEITRRVMESSDDCIALLTPDGSVVRVNERSQARFAAAGVVLAPGSDWFASWRPEDRATARTAASDACRSLPGTFAGSFVGDPGAVQWQSVITPVYDAAGTPVQLLAISRDGTSQKQQAAALSAGEARYRSIANAIPHIGFTATIDGTLDFVNDSWVEYTGLSLAQSTVYADSPATHPDDRELVAARWSAAMQSGNAYETECRLRRAADGVYHWHLMRAVPIRSSEGDIVAWFGTGTDIDDQKRVETEIARARDEALHAASMKSQFVATMSHEIRTPISGVIGMTELLLLTPLNDEQREYAKVVSDCGQSLLRVVNDILDFSKIDAGKLALESVEFDLQSQVKSITDLLHNAAERKHISLVARIDPNIPNSLIGDPGRLRQILMNLVGNAVKFTPEGGYVRVAASAGPADGDPNMLRFTVEDSGIGIAADVQKRLFEPFSQADGSTTRRFGGTGLGLSICKQLVSLMGGTIGVESVLDEGATFWFAVPFGPGSAEPTSVKTALGERRSQSRARRPERVLLVEDNGVNALLALQQFKHFGFEPTMVTNGREAVEAVENTMFDLVFMDCHMPEMDGFEATQEIRKRQKPSAKRLPIIAMTADARIEDRKACLAAGMDDYLSKPSSLANLAAVLERWLPQSGGSASRVG